MSEREPYVPPADAVRRIRVLLGACPDEPETPAREPGDLEFERVLAAWPALRSGVRRSLADLAEGSASGAGRGCRDV